jgi:hypothetical protein
VEFEDSLFFQISSARLEAVLTRLIANVDAMVGKPWVREGA